MRRRGDDATKMAVFDHCHTSASGPVIASIHSGIVTFSCLRECVILARFLAPKARKEKMSLERRRIAFILFTGAARAGGYTWFSPTDRVHFTVG